MPNTDERRPTTETEGAESTTRGRRGAVTRRSTGGASTAGAPPFLPARLVREVARAAAWGHVADHDDARAVHAHLLRCVAYSVTSESAADAQELGAALIAHAAYAAGYDQPGTSIEPPRPAESIAAADFAELGARVLRLALGLCSSKVSRVLGAGSRVWRCTDMPTGTPVVALPGGDVLASPLAVVVGEAFDASRHTAVDVRAVLSAFAATPAVSDLADGGTRAAARGYLDTAAALRAEGVPVVLGSMLAHVTERAVKQGAGL